MSTPRVVAATLALIATACTVRLPAPPTPARRAPSIAVPADPPGPGEGRIVIETVDAPATVELITGQALDDTGRTSVRRLCTTPCVADLPRGEHELVLSVPGTNRTGRVVARIEDRPAVLVAELGERTVHPHLTSIGTILLAIGAPMTLVSAGAAAVDDDVRGNAVYATIGISLASTLIGALMLDQGRTVIQDASAAQYPIE